MLKVENLTVRYGEVLAIKNISIEVKEREIVAIIGSNGAGKTTLLNSIMNIVPKKGKVLFLDSEITKMPTYKIASLGISYLPDKRTIIGDLTVKDNLLVAVYKFLKEDKNYLEKKLESLFENFPNLKNKLKLKAGLLSGGEQQMLSIAQALIRQPKLIILDEPTAGLSPKLVKILFDTISFMKKNNLTVLIVEQNVNKTIETADRVYVLKNGKITDKGIADDFKNKTRLKQAYFGG